MKNIFDWLDEITLSKSKVFDFSEKDWGIWNSYLINRFVSMNPNYIFFANQAQDFNPQDKTKTYQFYKQFIPKKKVWLKYLKSKNSINNDLLKYLGTYFECSSKEALEYYNILSKQDIKEIIYKFGLEEKEIKTLLK